jgi:putative membrane protein
MDEAAYKPIFKEEGTELSSRRTGMSFQRTRMSADRTLMSVIRTSLSLISFGFTINKGFEKLKESNVLTESAQARHFGTTLVAIGIGMLILGIVYHVQFMIGLRHERKAMVTAGLVHGESKFPPSLTLLTAIVLLALGILTIMSLVFHFGPFE